MLTETLDLNEGHYIYPFMDVSQLANVFIKVIYNFNILKIFGDILVTLIY